MMTRARFSLALGPAGGSPEYELALALADVARLCRQLENERENYAALETKYLAADRELEHLTRTRRKAS